MYNLLLLFLQTKNSYHTSPSFAKTKKFSIFTYSFFQKQLLQHRGQKFHLLQKTQTYAFFPTTQTDLLLWKKFRFAICFFQILHCNYVGSSVQAQPRPYLTLNTLVCSKAIVVSCMWRDDVYVYVSFAFMIHCVICCSSRMGNQISPWTHQT